MIRFVLNQLLNPLSCKAANKLIVYGYAQSYCGYSRGLLSGDHSLSLERIEGADNLELEAGTDPHSVGVHQLLDYEGSAIPAHLLVQRGGTN